MTDTDHYVWRDPFAEIEALKASSSLNLDLARDAVGVADEWRNRYQEACWKTRRADREDRVFGRWMIAISAGALTAIVVAKVLIGIWVP